jgi:hypothetical protein
MTEDTRSRTARMAARLEAQFEHCDRLTNELFARATPNTYVDDMPLAVALMRVCVMHGAAVARLARCEEEHPKKSQNRGSNTK